MATRIMFPSTLARGALLAALALGATACQTTGRDAAEAAERALHAERLRADNEQARAAALERDVARLREDLQQAESALVAIESGLRGVHTRAASVSALADARIQLEQAQSAAPWRTADAKEARAKLDEAEHQLRDGRYGSAIFFASRAQRIASSMLQEAKVSARRGGPQVVRRANLRSGPSTDDAVVEVLAPSTRLEVQQRQGAWLEVRTPSGRTGWLHSSLLR
jgi:hypothetical protein